MMLFFLLASSYCSERAFALTRFDAPLTLPKKTTSATEVKTEVKNNILRLKKNPVAPAMVPLVMDPEEAAHPELAAEYWNDHRIHGFGNVGWSGAFHAFVAPLFTMALDKFAYAGTNVRIATMQIIEAERHRLGRDAKVRSAVDLGTGVGATARALRDYFQPQLGVAAVDTSREMLRKATELSHHHSLQEIDFLQANAEDTMLPANSFDVVTVSFVMHEAPSEGRLAILKEAKRLVSPGGTIALCDIHLSYSPSSLMQEGEPYLMGYLNNFDAELQEFRYSNPWTQAGYGPVHRGRLNLWTFHNALDEENTFDTK